MRYPRSERSGIGRPESLRRALVVAAVVFLIDRLLKVAVQATMFTGQSTTVVPGVLHLTYIRNAGGAFGILAGSPLILLIGSLAAVAVVLWLLLTGPPSRVGTLACGLVLGGAAGNLADRLLSGEVTDYIDILIWPIFNAADVAIVVGVILLLLCALRSPEKG